MAAIFRIGLLGTDKVRDHCHVSGKYRGAAHDKCNLNFHHRHRVPVIIHNLKGYDSHLIIKLLGSFTKDKITCIANDQEEFISFSLGKFVFLDRMQFMSASLETLANNLKNSGSKFKHLSSEFVKIDY